jgi:hypothetical protein
MNMDLLLYCSLTTIAFINIIVHSIGLYLLLCLHKNNDGDINQMYIINLSAVELLGNTFWFLTDLLNLIEVFITPLPIIADARVYISFITCTMFLFVYYMSMVYITIDKFLEILLNIKYPIYCNTTKTKYLLTVTWVLGFFFCISLIVVCKLGGFEYRVPFVKYVYPTFDFLFICIVVACYSYIIHRYKKTRSSIPQCKNKLKPQNNVFNVCFKSRFYISFLLMLTFMCLVIMPDLIYLFCTINHHDDVIKSPNGILLILYHISFHSDAWIYIFLQPHVKRLLLKKLSVLRIRCCNNIHNCTQRTVRTRHETRIEIIGVNSEFIEMKQLCS